MHMNSAYTMTKVAKHVVRIGNRSRLMMSQTTLARELQSGIYTSGRLHWLRWDFPYRMPSSPGKHVTHRSLKPWPQRGPVLRWTSHKWYDMCTTSGNKSTGNCRQNHVTMPSVSSPKFYKSNHVTMSCVSSPKLYKSLSSQCDGVWSTCLKYAKGTRWCKRVILRATARQETLVLTLVL